MRALKELLAVPLVDHDLLLVVLHCAVSLAGLFGALDYHCHVLRVKRLKDVVDELSVGLSLPFDEQGQVLESLLLSLKHLISLVDGELREGGHCFDGTLLDGQDFHVTSKNTLEFGHGTVVFWGHSLLH